MTPSSKIAAAYLSTPTLRINRRCYFSTYLPDPSVIRSIPAGTSVVRFEEEILNLGESFRLSESVVIAPKEGIYEFIFNGYKKGSSKEHVLKVSLRLNGKKVFNSMSEELVGDHTEEHNFRYPISMHSLLKMKKGDRVDVIISQGTLHSHNSHYPIRFSGKLLFDEDAKSQNPNSLASFYFVLQKRTGFNTSNSVIPFEVESLNVGGAFDKKKNAFIAPAAGIYEFTLKGYKTITKESTYVSLRLNGEAMANSYADWINYHDHHTQFSITSILKVELGDVVDLYLKQGKIYDDDNQYTIFTGKLLSLDYHPPDSLSNNSPIFYSLAVFFNVQKTTKFSSRNQVVPFEIEVLNVGEGFNISENAFIAPRGGIYEFCFVGIKTVGYTELLSIVLRLNGFPATYASADAARLHPFHTPISFQSILKIKKGDRVDLFLENGGIYDDINQYTSTQFTGKLLFAFGNETKR